MIPKNLKVGDKFKDGNREYEVIEVVGEDYISKAITDGDVKTPSVAKDITEPDVKKEDAKITKTDVNRMSVSKLEAMSKELGLEIGTGAEMKKAIIEKLGL